MPLDLGQICAFVGMIVSALISIPQLLRVLRRGVRGVSGLTWALSTCSFGLWCAYGALKPVLAQIPGNLITGVGSALVVVAMLRRGLSPRLPVTVILSLSAAGIVGFGVFGVEGLGWTAFSVNAIMRLPQLRAALVASNLDDLSRLTWSLHTLAAGAWLTYGALKADLPISTSSALSVLVGLAILSTAALRDRGEVVQS